MTDTVTAKLAEWETLTGAATEGPWEAVGDGDPYLRWGDVATRGEPGDRFIVCEHAGPDAEFIAAAREMVPALLGFVEDVLRLTDEADAVARGHFGHRPCEAFARKVLADRMRAALTKRIGGSDEPSM